MKKTAFIFNIIATFALLMSSPAFAWEGWVVSVHDGDTFTVQRADGSREKIRLFGVDCPETQYPGRWKNQPYSRIAADFTRNLFKDNKHVSIFEMGESYGRVVGVVIQLDDGKTVQEELVAAGLACIDPRYCKNSIGECKNWKRLQKKAQKARRGLWLDKNPTAPWDWRHRKAKGK